MERDSFISSAPDRLRRILLTGFSQAIAKRCRLDRFLTRALTRSITPATQDLNVAVGQLQTATRTMESRFLACGDALEQMSASSDTLVRHTLELVHLAAGRDQAEQIITDTMSVLTEPLAFLNRYTERLQEQTDSLASGCTLLSRLIDFEADLQSAVAPLRATRTMFRVEASRLPEAEQAAFLTVSEQIEMLHNRVRETIGAEFAKLEEARSGASQIVKQFSAAAGLQRQVLERERTQIASELEVLRQQIELNATRDHQLTARGLTIQSAVSKVVVALQNQDIVSQRTGHLLEGIAEIRALIEGLEAGRSESLPHHLARLCALAGIQAGQASGALAQLTETASEVSAAAELIVSTIEGPATENQDEDCLLISEFGDVTAAASSTIQVLLEIVDKTRQMVGAAVDLGADSQEHIQPVNSVTTQLSDCVETLSNQMNLVALNAQIQAVQIGAGTGLEVLAAHTAAVATETSRFGEQIRENIGRLRAVLQSDVEFLTDLCETGRLQQTHMESGARRQEDCLRARRDELLKRVENIRQDASAVRSNARRVMQASALRPEEQRGLEATEAALGALAAGLKHTAAKPHDLGIHLDTSGYTMAAEHENHRKFVGGTAVATEESIQPGTGAIELF